MLGFTGGFRSGWLDCCPFFGEDYGLVGILALVGGRGKGEQSRAKPQYGTVRYGMSRDKGMRGDDVMRYLWGEGRVYKNNKSPPSFSTDKKEQEKQICRRKITSCSAFSFLHRVGLLHRSTSRSRFLALLALRTRLLFLASLRRVSGF